jgi:hypothetical protein
VQFQGIRHVAGVAAANGWRLVPINYPRVH